MKRVLLCLALFAWSGLACAVVYKWVDADGKVQYGDRPPDGVHAELVQLLGTHTSVVPAPPPPKPAAGTQKSAANATSKEKKAVEEDVAATREKQCADAQDRYKKLIEGRRMYKTGDNGERIFLTSEEIDTARLNAKQEIDAVCSNSSSP